MAENNFIRDGVLEIILSGECGQQSRHTDIAIRQVRIKGFIAYIHSTANVEHLHASMCFFDSSGDDVGISAFAGNELLVGDFVAAGQLDLCSAPPPR